MISGTYREPVRDVAAPAWLGVGVGSGVRVGVGVGLESGLG